MTRSIVTTAESLETATKAVSERRFITVRQLGARLGLHRATIYRMLADPNCDLPKPRKFGAKASRWSLEEIEEWEARQ